MNSHKVKISYFAIYKLVLDYIYSSFISVKYSYYGFVGGFSLMWYIASWLIFIFLVGLVTKIINRNNSSFSSMMLFFLCCLSFTPFLSMLSADYDVLYKLGNLIMWAILIVTIYIFQKKNSGYTIKYLNNNINSITYFLMIFNVLIVVFVSGYYGGFRFSFDLSDVYGIRSEAKLSGIPTIISYLFNWSRIIIPVLMVYFFNKRKYELFVLLIFIQILSFSFDGLKFVALITIAAIVVPIAIKILKNNFKFYNLFLLGLSFVCMIGIIEYSMFSESLITSLIPFRTLFLPDLIGTWFFDYFKTNTPDFYKASFLRYFGFDSDYSNVGIDYIISGVYFGNIEGRANNGLIADAMTNFGYFGIIIYPIILSALILLGDKCTKHNDAPIKLLVAINYSYCLTNTFLPVILMTYGGIVIFLIFGLNKKFIYQHAYMNNKREIKVIG